MNIKIVADSSSDILDIGYESFKSAPLKIITDKKEFVDDANLDIKEMVDFLGGYKGKSSTSCPNQNDWLECFGEAERIFCVTITSTLSGSYNSAMLAKQVYEEKHPERKVFILDSLSTGAEMALIIEKFKEIILSGTSFEDACTQVAEYSKKTGLIFMLESMRNLANNGRVSPIVAKMAGLLGIRVVGKASAVGDLEPLSKCRGEAKAFQTITEVLKKEGVKSGKIKITHCFNETAAKALQSIIKKEIPNAETKIYSTRGLCSFYAEKGGMIIGFEKQ